MRLEKVENGQRLPQKLLMAALRLLSGARVVDVLRTSLYRPELFGRPFAACLHQALRGPSEWSVGERELFAAFVSRRNQCAY